MMDGERERRGVYDLLLEMNKMVATKLQGKIANLFVSRTSTLDRARALSAAACGTVTPTRIAPNLESKFVTFTPIPYKLI